MLNPRLNQKMAKTFAGVALLIVMSIASSTQAETWTDLRGTRTIEAKMLGLWNENVVLDMNGRRVSVPLKLLKSDSRIQAEEIWERMEAARRQRVRELQAQANSDSAPAPKPLPTPPDPADYQTLPANQKLAVALEHLQDQMYNGHLLLAYFDSLPPSHQADIDRMAKSFADKVSPGGWSTFVKTLHSVGELVVTRQNWIFSNPRMEALDPDHFDLLRDQLLSSGGLLRVGFDPQSMDLSRMKSVPFRQWLAERSRVMAPYIAAAMNSQDSDSIGTFTVVSENGDKGVVKWSRGGLEHDVHYVRVEGFWVPDEQAKSWPQFVSDNEQMLKNAPNGSLFANESMAIAGLVEPLVSSLMAAEDEGAFHQAMETLVGQFKPSVDLLAASMNINVGGNRGAGPGPRGASAPPSGYGEGYGMTPEEMYGEGYGETEPEEGYGADYPGMSGEAP